MDALFESQPFISRLLGRGKYLNLHLLLRSIYSPDQIILENYCFLTNSIRYIIEKIHEKYTQKFSLIIVCFPQLWQPDSNQSFSGCQKYYSFLCIPNLCASCVKYFVVSWITFLMPGYVSLSILPSTLIKLS